jgi:hypothetical protein
MLMNNLARRLGLSLEDHRMIERLAGEYQESYTEFLRGVVESWAQQHRDRTCEDAEYDPGYSPDREGPCSHHGHRPKEREDAVSTG